MRLFPKIFDRSKQKSNKPTIEAKDKRKAECPYCRGKLKKIPGRKTRCPHCGQYMYVRTRPRDRARVVLTKDQAERIDEEWSVWGPIVAGSQSGHIVEKEEMEKERKILRRRFGREPSENDVRWRILNKQLVKHAKNDDWGFYRNTRFEMAELLRKEIKLKQALRAYLEVCYLDLNGPDNMSGMNDPELLKEFPPFDPKNSAFLAPAIIDYIRRINRVLGLRDTEIKQLFIEHNKKVGQSLRLPITPKGAWEKLASKIESDRRIDSIDVNDQDNTIQEIENLVRRGKIEDALRLLNRVKSLYYRKKYEIDNPEKIKEFVSKLLKSKERTISNIAESLMILLVKKNRSKFESLAIEYTRHIRKNFNSYLGSRIIGQLASINVDWIRPLIPKLKKAIKEHKEWGVRRSSAFNIGSIGEKNPELVKDIVPTMVKYIKSPFEVTKRPPLKVEAKRITFSMDLSPEKMLGIDQTQWLKDAYIDTLGIIAKGDKSMIQPYQPLFEKIARKDKSEYSRKKAKHVLEILEK